jgi:hypothetical protein
MTQNENIVQLTTTYVTSQVDTQSSSCNGQRTNSLTCHRECALYYCHNHICTHRMHVQTKSTNQLDEVKTGHAPVLLVSISSHTCPHECHFQHRANSQLLATHRIVSWQTTSSFPALPEDQTKGNAGMVQHIGRHAASAIVMPITSVPPHQCGKLDQLYCKQGSHSSQPASFHQPCWLRLL